MPCWRDVRRASLCHPHRLVWCTWRGVLLWCLSQIGEGSFGVVRRAVWRGMQVAVKELKLVEVRPARAPPTSTHYHHHRHHHRRRPHPGNPSHSCTCVQHQTELGAPTAGLTATQMELRHEAEMMRRVCNHDSIVQFVGVLLRPRPAVVTKFMRSGSLEELLVRGCGCPCAVPLLWLPPCFVAATALSPPWLPLVLVGGASPFTRACGTASFVARRLVGGAGARRAAQPSVVAVVEADHEHGYERGGGSGPSAP